MARQLSGKFRCVDETKCGSHDALRKYDDGTGFCFSCHTFFKKEEVEGVSSAEENEEDFEETTTEVVTKSSSPAAPTPKSRMKVPSPEEIKTYMSRGFQERLIKKALCEFYGVKVTYTSQGSINAHYYPYEDGAAYKIRKLPKDFIWSGKSTALFGREHFTGGGKRLIIAEGEIDTLSIAQASLDRYNKMYPVVGVSSSAMSKSILEEREWIRTFKEVVLCFDNDEAGKKIEAEAIKIIGADRVRLVRLGKFNDANELLIAEGAGALMQVIFDAEAYRPEGIIGKEALWDALVNYNNVESHPYSSALAGVNEKLKGKRAGEIALFISGTGSGKSTILREEMLNILETSDAKIGIVSLEESPAETARKLAGMAIDRNPAKEEIPIEDLKIGFDKVFGDNRVILLDHQGSINDNSIVDQLEYMCLSGCAYLFIDHITILVSEGVENLTGNEAQDKVMNDLLRLVKRYPVWIGLVSHLRKAPGGGKSFEEGKLPSIDDIRGSGSIKQISFDIISFARDLTASNEEERNTILMRILKSRYTGLTGNVPGAKYIYDTGRLAATSSMGEDFVAI